MKTSSGSLRPSLGGAWGLPTMAVGEPRTARLETCRSATQDLPGQGKGSHALPAVSCWPVTPNLTLGEGLTSPCGDGLISKAGTGQIPTFGGPGQKLARPDGDGGAHTSFISGGPRRSTELFDATRQLKPDDKSDSHTPGMSSPIGRVVCEVTPDRWRIPAPVFIRWIPSCRSQWVQHDT